MPHPLADLMLEYKLDVYESSIKRIGLPVRKLLLQVGFFLKTIIVFFPIKLSHRALI